MAVYKPLVIEKNETDIKKIMRQLYRFSEDLKFTISNLSLDDNFSKESLDTITERGGPSGRSSSIQTVFRFNMKIIKQECSQG